MNPVTDDNIRTRISKLLSVDGQEIGWRAAEAASWLQEMLSLRARLAEAERERDALLEEQKTGAYFQAWEKVRTERDTLAADNARLKAVLERANPPPERAYDCLHMLEEAGMGKEGSPHGNTLTGMVREACEKIKTMDGTPSVTSQVTSNAAPEHVPPVPASGNKSTPMTAWESKAAAEALWSEFEATPQQASGNEETPETNAYGDEYSQVDDASAIASVLAGWAELCGSLERQRNAAFRELAAARSEVEKLQRERFETEKYIANVHKIMGPGEGGLADRVLNLREERDRLKGAMGNGDWADIQSLFDGKVKAIMEREAAQSALAVALRDRDELKRRVEELEKREVELASILSPTAPKEECPFCRGQDAMKSPCQHCGKLPAPKEESTL